MKRITIILLLLLYIPTQGQTNSYNPYTLLQEEDKQLHFGAGILSASIGYHLSYKKHKNKKRALITGICTSFAVGVAKELFDGGIQNEYVDPRDIWATTLGGIGISVTIPILQPKKIRYRKLDKWNGGYDYN